MAGQTIRTKQWGWNVGGTGTDKTAVTTGQTYVRRMLLCAEASADTVVVTDAAGDILVNWAAPVSLFETVDVDAKIKGLTLTMSSSVARCNIIVI